MIHVRYTLQICFDIKYLEKKNSLPKAQRLRYVFTQYEPIDMYV